MAFSDENLTLSLVRMAGAVLALLLIGIILYLVFRCAQRLLRPLGEAGTVIFLKLRLPWIFFSPQGLKNAQ